MLIRTGKVVYVPVHHAMKMYGVVDGKFQVFYKFNIRWRCDQIYCPGASCLFPRANLDTMVKRKFCTPARN
jgi:hypothetical protein